MLRQSTLPSYLLCWLPPISPSVIPIVSQTPYLPCIHVLPAQGKLKVNIKVKVNSLPVYVVCVIVYASYVNMHLIISVYARICTLCLDIHYVIQFIRTHACTHACTHARTHARTHTVTHTFCMRTCIYKNLIYLVQYIQFIYSAPL